MKSLTKSHNKISCILTPFPQNKNTYMLLHHCSHQYKKTLCVCLLRKNYKINVEHSKKYLIQALMCNERHQKIQSKVLYSKKIKQNKTVKKQTK